MARRSTIDQVLDLTQASGHRWFQAARDGLADPVLASAARKVVHLGADALDHLDLTGTQHRQVLADLALRLATIPTNRRRSA